MNLFHTKCGSKIKIYNDRLVIEVLEVSLSGDRITPAIMDIVENPGPHAGIVFICPKCDMKIEPNELSTKCLDCGHVIPLDAGWSILYFASFICETCYKEKMEYFSTTRGTTVKGGKLKLLPDKKEKDSKPSSS